MAHLCAPLRRRTVPPPPLAHVCGAAAAFRQDNYTALHCAVIQCRASCVESLLKAGADASLKTNVSDGHEGSGRGGVGLRGGRRGPAQAPHRFSAPPSFCHLLFASASTSALRPFSSQDGVRRETALDIAKRKNRTEVIKHLKNAAPASKPMVVVEGVVL